MSSQDWFRQLPLLVLVNMGAGFLGATFNALHITLFKVTPGWQTMEQHPSKRWLARIPGSARPTCLASFNPDRHLIICLIARQTSEVGIGTESLHSLQGVLLGRWCIHGAIIGHLRDVQFKGMDKSMLTAACRVQRCFQCRTAESLRCL